MSERQYDKSKVGKWALYKGERIFIVKETGKKTYKSEIYAESIAEGFFPVNQKRIEGDIYYTGEIPIDDQQFEWLTTENDPIEKVGKRAVYRGKEIYVHTKRKGKGFFITFLGKTVPKEFVVIEWNYADMHEISATIPLEEEEHIQYLD